jgi:hypothetical protein
MSRPSSWRAGRPPMRNCSPLSRTAATGGPSCGCPKAGRW